MLRRPFSTVLSSVSIRSLLSIRKCSTPLISTDDQIPAVRTTGISWTQQGIVRTKMGAYWGKGDPRNKVAMSKDVGMKDTCGAKLRSILMALELAKNDGLTRVRVLTDFSMYDPDYERGIRGMKKMNFKTTDGEPIANAELYERILNYMDEMEVVIEYRTPFITNTRDNEVIKLLSDENTRITRIYDSTPLTSTDDQITTVRTAGRHWVQGSYSRTLKAVYWGEGDPRNTVDGRNRVTTDLHEAALYSIVMALNQAKKDGLKRIRVLTNFHFSDPDSHRFIQEYKDHTLRKDKRSLKHELCAKILNYMEIMEVTIESRKSDTEYTSEIIGLLMNGRKNQSPDYIPYNFASSDWTITPKDSLPLEGRIVPTVYAVGRLPDGFNEGTYATLWDPESIEHLDNKPRSHGSNYYPSNDRLTGFQAMLAAIENAIKQAQSLNIPEIQVITNSIHFIEFFKKDWKTFDGGPLPNSDFHNNIKALIETTKVHFKGVQLADDNEDELLRKADEMANDERLLCPLPSTADEKITTVRTTGYQWMVNGIGRTRKGVYWGEGDPRNILKGRNDDMTDLCGTKLRAIVMALELANKDGIKRIRVQTDFKMNSPDYRNEMQKLKDKDFIMMDGNPDPNAEAYERIMKCMDEMEVIVEYRTPYVVGVSGNEVMELLVNDQNKRNPQHTPCNFIESDWTITPKDAPPMNGRNIPTVYAVGRLLDEWNMGDYASLWIPESIDHLEIKPRSLGLSERPSGVPLSIFQARLIAIYDAINEAQSLNIPEIQVITNSIHFIEFFKKDWRAADGRMLPNEKLYLEIKALTETTKVHFKGVKFAEYGNGKLTSRLNEMAKTLEKQPNNPLLERLDDDPFWNKKPQPAVV